jgi:hypothetical protein
MSTASSCTPFGAALRNAVRCRGLTLDRIRWHLARQGLHVGLSSLSDWQHGRSVPATAKSLRAVPALEEILGLPEGTLAALLSARRTTGLDESRSPVAELLRSVRDTSDDFDILTRSFRTLVDGERRAAVMRDHTVIRARRTGLDRYVMRYIGDRGCDIDAVRFGRLDNCRLGRVLRHPDPEEPALVAEMLFDQPLTAGETWVFDTETFDETGSPCTDFAAGFRQPVHEFVLELQFDPAVTPVDLHAFSEDGLGTGPIRIGDLALSSHRTVHMVASDIDSGVRGIGWKWAE